MMFGRLFRRNQAAIQENPEIKPETKNYLLIFGEVPAPAEGETVEYDGFTIEYRRSGSKIMNFCVSCGADVEFNNYQFWHEIKSGSWMCDDCEWLRKEYRPEINNVTAEIEKLEPLVPKLMASFKEFLGVEPSGFATSELRDAGLIVYRETPESVLGFILIDYSREKMHQLVTAVDGRLEPFSRGFLLYLKLDYYLLFPGSSGWTNNFPVYYNDRSGSSFLDERKKLLEGLEAEAEPIQRRIDNHQAAATSL